MFDARDLSRTGLETVARCQLGASSAWLQEARCQFGEGQPIVGQKIAEPFGAGTGGCGPTVIAVPIRILKRA